ncbi:GIY-YIG nuclease family protein [Proteinivorax tanatarense]|uniref:GIY-YIG nuclease family protein n=1 Tax=Proteinivorax tanatarense TaxID=1260629 RepID=A0AAU7VND1_9FIRM
MSIKKGYFTYILRCSDNSLYTGWTTDIENRVKFHNKGKGAKYTLPRRPVYLVYFEEHVSQSVAQKREWEIKQLSKKEKEKLIIARKKVKQSKKTT